jgi:hypothetical protein
MSAPTLDRPAATTQPHPSAAPRRRRPLLALVAAGLVLVAAAAGTSLALADRPSGRPAATGAPQDQPTGQLGDQGTVVDQNTTPRQPDTGTGTGDSGTRAPAPVLPDGTTPAYITGIDRARNRITVDVVQVFEDKQAEAAAIADGESPDKAQYLAVWVRNENSRLRTLPLAGDLRIKLLHPCEDSGDRGAQLDQLASNARTDAYYYNLHVANGVVRGIDERLAINAC